MIDPATMSSPYAIANDGDIAGQGGRGNTIISSGGIRRHVQNLIAVGSGYELQKATDINNKGQILVQALTNPLSRTTRAC